MLEWAAGGTCGSDKRLLPFPSLIFLPLLLPPQAVAFLLRPHVSITLREKVVCPAGMYVGVRERDRWAPSLPGFLSLASSEF